MLWIIHNSSCLHSTKQGFSDSEPHSYSKTNDLKHNQCQNIHLQATTLPYTYYTTVAVNGTTNITEYGGLTFDIFNAFADRNNITYTITPPPDLSWGVQRSDGSWSGAIGMLVHSNVDVGVLLNSIICDIRHEARICSIIILTLFYNNTAAYSG